VKIGSINIDKGILLAPMEDVTDLPFRLICKRFGADVVYTEFVNSDGLTRGSKKTQKKMLFWEEERPLGIQIYGGEIERMATAAEIAESFQPDLIDINCGCWVKDVAMRGAGAGLLRDIPKMERLAATVVKAVKTPVGSVEHQDRGRGPHVRAGGHPGYHDSLPDTRPGAQGVRGLQLDPAREGSGFHPRHRERRCRNTRERCVCLHDDRRRCCDDRARRHPEPVDLPRGEALPADRRTPA
jgi:hypothetical protein